MASQEVTFSFRVLYVDTTCTKLDPLALAFVVFPLSRGSLSSIANVVCSATVSCF